MRNIFKLILLALAFAAITACGGSSGSKDDGGLSMNLRFEQPQERASIALESLYLIVANEDLNITKDSYDLLQLYNEGSGSFTVSGLTDGDKYYFKVYGYAEDSMVYYGAASLVVQPGSNNLDLYVRLTKGQYEASLPSFCVGSMYNGASNLAVSYADSVGSFYVISDNNLTDFYGPVNMVNFSSAVEISGADAEGGFEGVYSGTLTTGDTFTARAFFTNMFGQSDFEDRMFFTDQIFTDAAVIDAIPPHVDASAANTITWTLPVNSGSNEFTAVAVRIIDADTDDETNISLGVSAASYTIPAGTLKANGWYMFHVITSNGCNMSVSETSFMTNP
ncbi:hypothetical protein [Geovibrio ferrireducens]|jgi:hypothetical protein|uniref:hypothetical protein n=1 Tax=Geovibrio ferrireducens TaxID=46201 RepID=UPI0022462E0F|nr:hypothetical protein [Geovibrio ferrireducens]